MPEDREAVLGFQIAFEELIDKPFHLIFVDIG